MAKGRCEGQHPMARARLIYTEKNGSMDRKGQAKKGRSQGKNEGEKRPEKLRKRKLRVVRAKLRLVVRGLQ